MTESSQSTHINVKNLSYFMPTRWMTCQVEGQPEFRALNSLGMVSTKLREVVCASARGRALTARFHRLLVGSFVLMFTGAMSSVLALLINWTGTGVPVLSTAARFAQEELTQQFGRPLPTEYSVPIVVIGIGGLGLGLLLHYDAYRAFKDLVRIHNSDLSN